MTDEDLDKLLKLAKLTELHGKMGGTKPFDRLLGPVARELHTLTDKLEKEEQEIVAKEKADAEAKQRAMIEESNRQHVEQAEAEEANRAKAQAEINQEAQRSRSVEQDHIDVTRRI